MVHRFTTIIVVIIIIWDLLTPVVDSTGSDGVVAPTPIGVRKNNGTTACGFPTQRQGISAYGVDYISLMELMMIYKLFQFQVLLHGGRFYY